MSNDLALTIYQGITLGVMMLGLLSLATFIIPGLMIIWSAALVYGLVTGFNWNSGILFAIITLLMIAGSLVDNFIMGASAKITGASWAAVGISMLGGVIGVILFPPLGGLLGAMLGLFIVEIIRIRKWRQAFTSTGGMLLGCGGSVIVRMAIATAMILLWFIWIW